MTTTSASTRQPRTVPGAVVNRLAATVNKAPRVPNDLRADKLAASLRRLGYKVDIGKGSRACNFVERRCRHTKGEFYGKPFELGGWQYVIIFCLFGVVDAAGKRQFRRLWLEVAKKNGKTEIIAAVLLYCLLGLDEYGAEVYSAASSRDQASLTYRVMASMVKQDKVLRKRAKWYDSQKRIYVPQTESFYQALSADADYNDGINPFAVGVDEVHRHKDRGLWDVLAQGQGTRSEPLFLAITTAGSGRDGLAWDEHEHARQVVANLVLDPRLLAFIFSVPDDADWRDEKLWKLANPGLGDFLREDDLREAVTKAAVTPTEEHSVRRLRLNQWVAAETKWLDLLAWDKCGKVPGQEALLKRNLGRDFYGGLDISHSRDFTSWTMFWPNDEGDEIGGDVVWRFWLPEAALDGIRSQMRPTLEAWVRAGFITLCTDEVIDLNWVRDQILADCEKYALRELGYDKFHAHGIVSDLMTAGLTLVDVPQYHRSLNAPSKQLERMLALGLLEHSGNPVARWMASNAVAEVDRDDRIRPSRLKSADKIDGVLSLLFSLERAMANAVVPDYQFYAFQ